MRQIQSVILTPAMPPPCMVRARWRERVVLIEVFATVLTSADDGSPQRRSYRLASIRADQLGCAAARAKFWSHARWALDKLR
jgi:hypothetical protein